MIILRKLFVVLGFSLFVGLSSARNVRDGQKTILEIVEDPSGDFTTLATALELAGLSGAFDCKWFWCPDYTVFAPANEAFGEISDLDTKLTQDARYLIHLKSLLLYHTLHGTVLAKDIRNGADVRTLQRETVTTTIEGDAVFINNAQVVAPDIIASGGVAHGINKVLVPSFIEKDNVQIASDAGIFSTLIEAASLAGLAEALQGQGPFTIFAVST
jgi:uncharacterized surface protein with fasciclin (FAS1) repeats